jgi:hypothetical protein
LREEGGGLLWRWGKCNDVGLGEEVLSFERYKTL